MSSFLLCSFVTEVKPCVLSHFWLDLLKLHLVLILECLDLLFLLQFDFISVGSLHSKVIWNWKVLKVIEVRINTVKLGLFLQILTLLISCESDVVQRHRHFLLVMLIPDQIFWKDCAKLCRYIFWLVFIIYNSLNNTGIPHAIRS